jgi:hypothetical protein
MKTTGQLAPRVEKAPTRHLHPNVLALHKLIPRLDKERFPDYDVCIIEPALHSENAYVNSFASELIYRDTLTHGKRYTVRATGDTKHQLRV